MADYGTYVSVGRAKAGLRVTGASDDAALLRVLEAASRQWDDWCGRHFYHTTGARRVEGPPMHGDWSRLWLPGDLLEVTSVAIDADNDGVVETTVDSSTYELVSLQEDGGPPYGRIDRRRGSWPCGRSIEITGVWGYSAEFEPSGAVAEEVDDTETEIDMTAGHGLTGGELIAVDDELMYVQAVATNTATVIRGVNGTSAAAHANLSPVRRRRYPRPIEEATLMRAARTWRAGQTGYAADIASPETGGFPASYGTLSELHLANPYRLAVV